MNDKQREEMLEAIEAYRKRATKDKESARKSLFELGICTKKGNLRKPYKNKFL